MYFTADEESAFRKQLQLLLQEGRPLDAEAMVMNQFELLRPENIPLVQVCLLSSSEEVTVTGWKQLQDAIESSPTLISAVSINMSWPGHIDHNPDANGHLTPLIETNLYSDNAFPFSNADRSKVLEGYSNYGSEWQGCFDDIIGAIGIEGISQIYGPAYVLESSSRNQSASLDYHVAILASCLVAVRIHLAVARTVHYSGLPRPMAVLVESNEAYPFFAAPVVSAVEYTAIVVDRPISPETSNDQRNAHQPEPSELAAQTITADVHPTGAELRKRLTASDHDSSLGIQSSYGQSWLSRLLGK